MEQDIQLGKVATKIKEIFEQHGNGSEMEEYFESLSLEDVSSLSDEDIQFLLDIFIPIKETLDIVAVLWEITGVQGEFQKAHSNLLPAIINQVKGDPMIVAYVWSNTVPEVQKASLPSIIDQVKGDPELVEKIWGKTVQEAQEANSKLLLSIIDQVKGNPEQVANVWVHTVPEVQKEAQKANSKLFPSIIDQVKGNPKLVERIWRSTVREIQEANLHSIIVDYAKGNPELVAKIWGNTVQKIQEANLHSIIVDYAKGNPKLVAKIWGNTVQEAQKANSDLFPSIIGQVKGYPGMLVESVWEKTVPEVQKANLPSIIDLVKEDSRLVSRAWRNTVPEAQKANLHSIIVDYAKGNPELVVLVWALSVKEAQENKIKEVIDIILKENSDLVGEVLLHTHPEVMEQIWSKTDKEFQKSKIEKIIKLVQENSKLIGVIWANTDKEVKNEKFVSILESNPPEIVNKILKSTNPKELNDLWDMLEPDKQKQYFDVIIDVLCNNPEAKGMLSEFLKKIDERIDAEKLSDILMMKDQEYIYKYMMDEILKKNIGKENIDIEGINQEIGKINEIFLTNNLPEFFKLYSFFKFHPNHNSNNQHFYAGISNEERDKKILQDLFTTELESDNSQMIEFLELIYNGNIAYQSQLNGKELPEEEKAILLVYSDTLSNLYKIYGNKKLDKIDNSIEKIEILRKLENIGENENVGDYILTQFLKQIGLNIEKYAQGKENLSENLLEYMRKDKERSQEKNRKKLK